jgi:Tol biopolymer transport system component
VLLSPEGQFVRRLAEGYLPAWSPDGAMLVFVSQQGSDTSTAELHRINADGSGEMTLTNNEAWEYGAAWTRDNSGIVFGSQMDGGWRLYRMSLDGLGVEPLLAGASGNAPSLSPDGTMVAFTSDRDGDDDLYVLDLRQGSVRNLTSNADHDDNAAWSPEGARIAFSSDRTGKNEIYVMNTDGSGAIQLTHDAELIPNIPSWAPDGHHLVFGAAPSD